MRLCRDISRLQRAEHWITRLLLRERLQPLVPVSKTRLLMDLDQERPASLILNVSPHAPLSSSVAAISSKNSKSNVIADNQQMLKQQPHTHINHLHHHRQEAVGRLHSSLQILTVYLHTTNFKGLLLLLEDDSLPLMERVCLMEEIVNVFGILHSSLSNKLGYNDSDSKCLICADSSICDLQVSPTSSLPHDSDSLLPPPTPPPPPLGMVDSTFLFNNLLAPLYTRALLLLLSPSKPPSIPNISSKELWKRVGNFHHTFVSLGFQNRVLSLGIETGISMASSSLALKEEDGSGMTIQDGVTLLSDFATVSFQGGKPEKAPSSSSFVEGILLLMERGTFPPSINCSSSSSLYSLTKQMTSTHLYTTFLWSLAVLKFSPPSFEEGMAMLCRAMEEDIFREDLEWGEEELSNWYRFYLHLHFTFPLREEVNLPKGFPLFLQKAKLSSRKTCRSCAPNVKKFCKEVGQHLREIYPPPSDGGKGGVVVISDYTCPRTGFNVDYVIIPSDPSAGVIGLDCLGSGHYITEYINGSSTSSNGGPRTELKIMGDFSLKHRLLLLPSFSSSSAGVDSNSSEEIKDIKEREYTFKKVIPVPYFQWVRKQKLEGRRKFLMRLLDA